MSAFAMADDLLKQLDSAKTQEQFDQALENGMMPIFLLIAQAMGEF